jgi:hypothetical protein
MTAEAIVTVSAAVVALVQLAKWAGLTEANGPLAVIGFSLLGVAIWIVGGDNWPPARTDVWPIFAGCIAVATSAAGVFGFTRAAVGAVTRATPPPAGAAEQAVETGGPGIDYERLASEMERQRQERVRARLHAVNDGVKAPSRVDS